MALDMVVATIAALAFWQAGLNLALTTDDAFYFYAGHQLADGVPPYVSGFDTKGPGSAIAFGATVALAKAVGADPLIGSRVAMLVLSCLVVVGFFRLSLLLVGDVGAALLATICSTTMGAFGVAAIGGPNPATLVVCGTTWFLVFAVRGNYGIAAFIATATGIAWQPMLVYGLFPALLAWFGTGTRRERIAPTLRALVGFMAPLAGVTLSFASRGAFDQAIEGTFTFNMYYLERGSSTLKNVWWIVRSIIRGFPEATGMIVLGLLAIVAIAVSGIRETGVRKFVERHPWRALLLTIPAPAAWSLLDYQSAEDFFVFLPYVVAGFAWLLTKTKDVLVAAAPRAVSPVVLVTAMTMITLFAGSMYRYRRDEYGWISLIQQRQAAKEIETSRAQAGTILAVNVPEFLVLTDRTTPARLLVLVPSGGLASLIKATYPTGFPGLIAEIEQSHPQTVLVGYIKGKGLEPLESWLNENFSLIRERPWRVYARK